MRRHSAFASEGIWWFVGCALIAIGLAKWLGPLYALPMLLPVLLLIALFQDPIRESPLSPRAILAPCDGRIVSIEKTRSGLLDRESLHVVIAVNAMGAYTLRAPVEGIIFDPRDNAREGSRMTGRGGMWIRGDEGADVVVAFPRAARIATPKSFRRYGERIGHGHRVAFLRLARRCEIYMPVEAMPRVQVGDTVKATEDVLAELPSQRNEDGERSAKPDAETQSADAG
ncbi:MAG: hypothetical protein AAAFM81_01600 [Pseudomonadota bacterium]